MYSSISIYFLSDPAKSSTFLDVFLYFSTHNTKIDLNLSPGPHSLLFYDTKNHVTSPLLLTREPLNFIHTLDSKGHEI